MQCHRDSLPLSLALSLFLWSVSDGWSRYCRWRSRIIQEWTHEDRSPDRRPTGGEGVLASLIFPAWRLPPPRQRTRGCPHMRWFALVWMCKEDVEADPEWLTHRLLQYPLATRASWQRCASHTWQTFNHFKRINSSLTTWTSCSRPAINLQPHDVR